MYEFDKILSDLEIESLRDVLLFVVGIVFLLFLCFLFLWGF